MIRLFIKNIIKKGTPFASSRFRLNTKEASYEFIISTSYNNDKDIIPYKLHYTKYVPFSINANKQGNINIHKKEYDYINSMIRIYLVKDSLKILYNDCN